MWNTPLNQPEPAGDEAVGPAGGGAGRRLSARLPPPDRSTDSHRGAEETRGEEQGLLPLDGRGGERLSHHTTGQQEEG